eukprot:TRINITY_DN525_c5_g1_i1.p1 TRINITY_DN525_c5_g1~~TRINITY_DN525_c5_g1_i1.p1  ORF type:complete len:918 (+),score=187.03 TRINITY_DN525_c5_g1_i1:73-2754(+)
MALDQHVDVPLTDSLDTDESDALLREDSGLVPRTEAELGTVWLATRSCVAACPRCGSADSQIRDTDVNAGEYLPAVTRAEIFMRVIGTRMHGKITRADSEVIDTLEYVENVLAQACDTAGVEESVPAVWCDTRDDMFQRCITAVLGAAELLIAADFQLDGDFMVFRYPEPGTFHRWVSRRAASVLRIVRAELDALRQGKRLLTGQVVDEVPQLRHTFDTLADRYQRADSYPTWSDALEWLRLRNLFVQASYIAKVPQEAAHASALAVQSNKYVEKILSYLEALQASELYARRSCVGVCASQSCRVSEDLQWAKYLRSEAAAAATPPPATTADSLHATQHEVDDGYSPGLVVTRTPKGHTERQEYALALPTSPSLLTREPRRQRAGLLNVAQNCFMNCLLQAYFMCPQFADSILQFPGRDEWPAEVPVNVKLVHRVQAVFAFLELSHSSCVNPAFVLGAVASAHPQFNDKGQHDPQEFADLFIDMVLAGFKESVGRSGPSAAVQQQCSRLRDLLVGERSEVSVGWDGELRGEPRTQPMLHFIPLYLETGGLTRPLPPQAAQGGGAVGAVRKLDFDHCTQNAYPTALRAAAAQGSFSLLSACAGILEAEEAPVTDELPQPDTATAPAENGTSVYDALEQLVIDFKDEDSDASATMIAFKRLPQLLMLYMPQRTASDGNSNVVCDFSKQLQLDRYSDSAQAHAARDRCRCLKMREKRLLRECAQHGAVIERLSVMLDDPDGVLMHEEIDALRTAVARRRAADARAKRALDEVRSQITCVYDGVGASPEFLYTFHAVIVHERVAQGGHFFAYAKDSSRCRWLRFDDAMVTTVGEDEVFSDRTRQGAYCFFYERNHVPTRPDVPAPLRRIVEEEDRRRQKILSSRSGAEALDELPACP